jgi:hypothetical protein
VLCVRDQGCHRIGTGAPHAWCSDGTHRRTRLGLLRICYTVHEMMAMRAVPHMVLRYEDLVSDPATLDRLRDYLGMDELGKDRFNLMIERASRSQWEMRKHGNSTEISDKALDRFDREPEGPVRNMAERVWRLLGEYRRVRLTCRRRQAHPSTISSIRVAGRGLSATATLILGWRGPAQIGWPSPARAHAGDPQHRRDAHA